MLENLYYQQNYVYLQRKESYKINEYLNYPYFYLVAHR